MACSSSISGRGQKLSSWLVPKLVYRQDVLTKREYSGVLLNLLRRDIPLSKINVNNKGLDTVEHTIEQYRVRLHFYQGRTNEMQLGAQKKTRPLESLG